jgi:hypothetical protein
MLHKDIQATEYYKNLSSLVALEEQECNSINQDSNVRGLAGVINKNLGDWQVAAELVRKYWNYERYSGASIVRNLQQFGLPGYMLTLKIITDQPVFKKAAQTILNTIANNPLNTNYTGGKAYDEKLWNFEDLTKVIYPGSIYLLGGWLGVHQKDAAKINTAWQAASKAKKIEAATNASVIKWTTNEFSGTLIPYETPASGDFINIILPTAKKEWLDGAINPADETNYRLLLSGPSGTSARMMLYFKWFHKLLKDDTAITAAIKTVLDSVNENSTYFAALSQLRELYAANPKSMKFEALAPWYESILKGIHMPPYNHHSAYEVETALTGLMSKDKV